MKRKSPTPRLMLHMAQARGTRVLQFGCAAAGMAGAVQHGTPALILGGLGAWIFAQAMPPANDALDRETGRDA